MASKIQIWDNHWKDTPFWAFLLLLVALIGIMLTTFLGADLFFKGNHFIAGIIGILIGVWIYFLVYRTLKHKSEGEHARGVLTGSALLLPFAGLAFFGGMALSNEYGFRAQQFQEFDALASQIESQLQTQETEFERIGRTVIIQIENDCRKAGDGTTARKRSDRADEMKGCYNVPACVDCKNPNNVNSTIPKLTAAIKQRFEAPSQAETELKVFQQLVATRNIRSHIEQYNLQQIAQTAPALMQKVNAHRTGIVNGLCPNGRNQQTLSPASLNFQTTHDCSSYNDVFCTGWGWNPFLILLALMTSCLIPIAFGNWVERAVITQSDEPAPESPGRPRAKTL